MQFGYNCVCVRARYFYQVIANYITHYNEMTRVFISYLVVAVNKYLKRHALFPLISRTFTACLVVRIGLLINVHARAGELVECSAYDRKVISVQLFKLCAVKIRQN